MSRATPSTSAQVVAEEFVCPEFNPSPAYRGFVERLRLARIERGLSIAEMSDEVGLTFRLAHEFENLAAPLPFEWLELWCQTVGVPFEDFLAIYWADECVWDERQAQLEIESAAPCINITEICGIKTPAGPNPDFGFLGTLHVALARLAKFFHSLISTL